MLSTIWDNEESGGARHAAFDQYEHEWSLLQIPMTASEQASLDGM
jgi:hypothetical protein